MVSNFELRSYSIYKIYGAHMNISFIIRWIFSCSLNSGSPPPTSSIVLTTEFQMVIIFWAPSPISSKCVSSWYLFLEPHLTTYHRENTFPIQIRNENEHIDLNKLQLWSPYVHNAWECWSKKYRGPKVKIFSSRSALTSQRIWNMQLVQDN